MAVAQADLRPLLRGERILSQSWEVYIIRARNGKLYTGITTDLDRRFAEHRSGRKGARFFRFTEPEAIVFRETHADRGSATRRELAIKKMTRRQKERLIAASAGLKPPR